jgi:quercetin dioxygenase-like cupin family protein
MKQRTIRATWSRVAAASLLAAAAVVYAQPTGLTRTVLTRADVSVPGREAVVARVELAPGGRAGRHTHPGDEISYVLEGEADLLIDGQPPRHLKPGDSFVIPAGVVHDAHNTGTVPARIVGVYVVEKGKPLASPAPDNSSKK